jgi:asparagine synthase (glutamine-hydrolysing)
MNVGFSIVCHADGPVELRLSLPDAGGLRGPALVTWAQDREAQAAVALVGRLYYREEVFARLGAEAPPEDGPDAALALAVYRRHGLEGLKQLEGEHALVVWDGRRRLLLAQRDPFGSYPLCWLAEGPIVAVSSSAEALAQLLPTRAFDLDYMAEFLMRPSPVSEVLGERTAFEKVRRVPAGTMVEIEAGGAVRRHPYWDWASRVERADGLTLEETGERFGHLLRRSVRERVRRGAVAAHLSGGMDSSAVVVAAREWLTAGVGRGPLATLSLVYDRPSLVGERAYAELVLRQGGPVEGHFLKADGALDYRWFDRPLPFHDEPYGGLAGLAMEQLLLDAAERLGTATVLTGLGSDEVLETGPYHIADLLRRGRWWKVWREAAFWGRAWNEGPWSVLRRVGLEAVWPVLMRDGVGAFWRGGFGSWPSLGRFTVPPWVRPEFARRHGMRRHGAEYARRWHGSPTERSVALQGIEAYVGDPCHWYYAAPRGIHLSHPFRDPRLIGFGLGIPASLKLVPGRRKPVLQEAFRGALPEEIRLRRDKRGFNDVYWRGLAGGLSRLEQMVRASPTLELGLFDADELIRVMGLAARGVGDLTACERLDKTLALIAWFEQAHRRRPLPRPTAIHRLAGPGVTSTSEAASAIPA